MGHAGTQISPSNRLCLNRAESILFLRVQRVPGSALERLHVEFDLLSKSAVENPADSGVIANTLFDLSGAASGRQGLNHEGVQLRVLCFLHAVMAQPSLELRIEALVITNAVEVMPLCHPFDVQYDQNHPERMVGENGPGDLLRRSDGVASRCKPLLEL